MARTVTWTHAAWSDLEGTADYIARDSKAYAAALVREARDAARSLAHFAERGRVVPEFDIPSVRELLVGNYRLIYGVEDREVQIVAFFHGSRDLEAKWGRSGS